MSIFKRLAYSATVLLLVCIKAGAAPVASSKAVFTPLSQSSPSFKSDEIIVKFKTAPSGSSSKSVQPSATALSSVNQLNGKHGIVAMQKVFDAPKAGSTEFDRVYMLKANASANVQDIVNEYKKDPNVLYAEPNYRYKAIAVPNDPGYSQQWGLPKIQAPNAWNLQTGAPGVVIAVIDTGIDYNHPDLKTKIWKNTREIAGNGLDDDNNGYIDDVQGWNFSDSPLLAPNDPKDDYGHGTHVAGIAAGASNNGIGISGVAWNCKVMNIKALGAGGYGYNIGLGMSIRYAADNGAKVINNSWGGPGYSEFIKDAIDYAVSKGVLVVSAAGNDGADMPIYPGRYENSIAVAATDSQDRQSNFSNYGMWVDVSAPGVGIYSTMPTYDVFLNQYGLTKNYTNMDGTSMATPFVAGLAALVASRYPSETNVQWRARIENGMALDPVDSLDPVFRIPGRINAYRALTAAMPPAPRYYDIRGTVRDNSGLTVAGATVTLYGAVDRTYITPSDGSYQFSGLIGEKSYTVSVSYKGKFFSPNIRVFQYLGMHQLNQDFLALPDPWSFEEIDLNSYGQLSLKMAADGTPHIAYMDGQRDRLNYATRVQGQWQTEVVDPLAGMRIDGYNNGYYVTVGVDNNQQPHLAYCEWDQVTMLFKLKYASKIGNNWVSQTVDPAPDSGFYCSMVFDPSGVPGIAYFDGASEVLKYARLNGSSWNIEVVSTATVRFASDRQISLTYDSGGKPYIVFKKDTENVSVAKKTGAVWSVENVVAANVRNVGIAVDSAGHPMFSYCEGNDLKFARWTGQQWNFGTIDKNNSYPNAAVGKFHSLATDSNGVPTIAYSYIEGQSKLFAPFVTTVLKLAYWNGQDWQKQIVSDKELASGAGISLEVSDSRIHLAHGYLPSVNRPDSYNRLIYGSMERPSGSKGTISGYIKNSSGLSLPNAKITLSGPQSREVVTGSDGYYEFRDLPLGNYTATPSYPNFAFTPPERKYEPLGYMDMHNQNYNGVFAQYYIVGYAADSETSISISGTTFTLSGYSAATLAAHEGWFFFDKLAPSSYTVVPEKAGYQFSPVSRSIDPLPYNYSTYQVFNGRKNWDVKSVQPSGNIGKYVSMKLAANNQPIIVYYDAVGGDLKYSAYSGSAWSGPSLMDSAGDVGPHASLALTSVGYPRMAYYDATGQNLKVMKWSGAAWGSWIVDSAGDVGKSAALGVDPRGYEHVAYYDATNKDLKCADWTGAAWAVRTADSSGDSGIGASIAVDKKNMSHIAYWSGGPIYYLKYMKWDGATGAVVTLQTVEMSGSASPLATSIALTDDGQPRISYYSSAEKTLKYAKLDRLSWVTEKVDAVGDISQTTAAVSSLALDSNGNAHISYYSHEREELKVAEWTGLAWSTQTLDSFGTVGLYSSIALDASGNSHVMYYDSTAKQLKYAKNLAPLNVSIRGFVKDANGLAVAGATVALAGTSNAIYITGADGSYRFMNLSTKTYSVSAQAFGYNLTPASRSYAPLTSNQDEENFIANVSPFIRGTVKDADGNPIKDAIVNLYGNKSTVTFITDTDGKYQFLNLAQVPYRVIASKMDYGFSPMLKNYDFPAGSGIDVSWNDNQNIIGKNIGRLVDALGKITESAVAVSTDGVVHVAYAGKPEVGKGGWIKYARLIDGQWVIETVYNTTDNWAVGAVAMALDSKQRAHIVYRTNSRGWYAKWNGAQWVTEGIYTSGQIDGQVTIALDRNDRPHMVFSARYTMDYLLEYVYWNGFSWTQNTLEVPVLNTSFGQQLSLALDSLDRPHIAYMVWVNANTSYLKYTKFNGTAWLKYVIDASALNIGWCPSLALDKNNNAAISYFVMPGNALSLKLAKFNGAAWAIQSVDATALMGANTVKWGANGHPQIAYSGKEGLKHARWDGVKWIYKVLDNNINMVSPNMALDPYDLHPHMAYLDKVSQDVRYVKYITTISATGFFAKGYVPGTDKIIKTFAVNENGLVAAEAGPAVDPLNGAPLAGVDINLGVEAGVFSGAASLTAIETTPEPSHKVTIKPTALAFVLQSDSLQPSRGFTISLSNYGSLLEPSVQGTTLAIGLYDPINIRWIVLPSRMEDNSVIAAASSLGTFALLQLSPTLDLSNVIVFPNPYKSGSKEYGGNAITFSGLTQAAHIKVFNIAGELVTEIDKNDSSDRLAWDMTNTNREKLASGVYIYYITNPASADQKAKGRFSIIK